MCNAADLFGGVAIAWMDLNNQKINPAGDARDGYLWYTHLRRAKNHPFRITSRARALL
jgi:hypothetical protein